jgi:hypothetical protein
MIKIYKSLADATKKDLAYTPLIIDSELDAMKETVILASQTNVPLLQELSDLKEKMTPSQEAQLKLLNEFKPEELKTIQEMFAKDGKALTYEDMFAMIGEGKINLEQIMSLTNAAKVYAPTITEIVKVTDQILKAIDMPSDVQLNNRARKDLLDLTLQNEYNFF